MYLKKKQTEQKEDYFVDSKKYSFSNSNIWNWDVT